MNKIERRLERLQLMQSTKTLAAASERLHADVAQLVAVLKDEINQLNNLVRLLARR